MTSGKLLDAARPLELADGLVRIGGVVEVDGRISWFPREARGFAPVNQYLVSSGDDALLVDTGVALHESEVIATLQSTLSHGSALGLFLSRIVEYDSFGNSAAIARALPVNRIYAHFPSSEWLHYQPRHDRPVESADELWPDVRTIEFLTPLPGDTVEVGNGRRLELLGAPVRVLATYWLYYVETRTLMTSDMFGHVLMGAPEESLIVDESRDDTTVSDVQAHLLAKFEWLAFADTKPLRAGLKQIFSEREIDTVAPGFGKILRGRNVVQRHYELVDTALERMGVGAR